MIGAIAGDIIGSRFEHDNIKGRDFELFHPACRFTDDSVMTLAVCDALLRCESRERLSEQAISSMQTIGRLYPRCGFGRHFLDWIYDDNPRPYHSWGNGAAMRVSGCAYAADNMEDVLELSRAVTRVSHDHEDGMKGAEAVAAAVFLARAGKSAEEIREYMNERYYTAEFTLDEIRPSYSFDVSCRGSVPQALEAFYESDGFEDAVRNAVSIGGDSDTIAAITGSIAEAYYGVPQDIREEALARLDRLLKKILLDFESRYER